METSNVTLRKKKENEREEGNKKPKKKKMGRPGHLRIYFAEGHPQRHLRWQKLESFHKVPLIARCTPPRPPYPHEKLEPEALNKKRLRCSRFLTTLLMPWDLETKKAPCFNSWKEFTDVMQQWASDDATFIQRHRYALANRICLNNALNRDFLKTHTRWRRRSTEKNIRDAERAVRQRQAENMSQDQIARAAFQNDADELNARAFNLQGGLAMQQEMIRRVRNKRNYVASKDHITGIKKKLMMASRPDREVSGPGTENVDKGHLHPFEAFTQYTNAWAKETYAKLQDKTVEDQLVIEENYDEEIEVGEGGNDEDEDDGGVEMHPLNATQERAINQFMLNTNRGVQTLMLWHGGPGTGKTYTTQQIKKKLNVGPTGISAMNLPGGGWTIHSFMGWNRHNVNNAARFQKIRDRLGDNKTIIFDEISMSHAAQLDRFDQDMRGVKGTDEPFGGLNVILLGDFAQLPPVKKMSLHSMLVKFEMRSLRNLNEAELRGLAVFKKFQVLFFTQQERSRDDPLHTGIIAKLRDLTSKNPPVDDAVIKYLKDRQITEEELKKEKWRNATYIVKTNNEREAFNDVGIELYAKRMGEPYFTWVEPTYYKSDEVNDHGETLKEEYPFLKKSFCRGAPCIITKNVNPKKGIANGTMGTMHALIFGDEEDDLDLNALEPNVEYKITIPKFIIVKTNDGKLVPMPIEQKKIYLDSSKRHASGFKHYTHECTTAIALTFHKVQGKTLGPVVLVLGNAEGGQSTKLQTLLVGLSRVRRNTDLRIWPMTESQMNKLRGMKRDEDLVAWIHGYDEDGKWCPAEVHEYKKKLKREAMVQLRNIDNVRLIPAETVKKLVQNLGLGDGKGSIRTYRAMLQGFRERI